MDHDFVVDTATQCVHSDGRHPGCARRPRSRLIATNREGFRTELLLLLHGNTIIKEESSRTPRSVDESSLSENSNGSPKELPPATWNSQDTEKTTDTKSLIGKNAESRSLS